MLINFPSMKKENEKNIDDILNSIEGIHRVPAPDFFYTRLRARMEKEVSVPVVKRSVLQPAFIISGLVLLLLINAMVLLKNRGINGSNTIPTSARENDNLQIIATAYHINDISSEELNQ
jgi:hypothetical protein